MSNTSEHRVSVVLPAKNEADSLRTLLPLIRAQLPDAEVIVVNDGSSDDTASVCAQHRDVTVVHHQYSRGNGAAIKSGARRARGDIILFMDADGQHAPEFIPALVAQVRDGYDMAVGTRQARDQASFGRVLANTTYNRLASWMTGYDIKDLTSGFRAVRAKRFRKFLYLLPNRFSYPTTSTMAFFRSGYSVTYVPVRMQARKGKSHISLLRDGVRFLVIIVKIGALFSPMRLFLPVSVFLFLTGLSYYAYTYTTAGRFTNMSALLLISALLTFLIGIVSEQISALHYKDAETQAPE